MKNLAKLYKFLSVFLLSLLVYFTTSANCNKRLNNQGNVENRYQYSIGAKYNVPFLILMSGEEICVAQLPLIENGSVSVVYRLFTKSSTTEKEEESDWSISTSSSSRIPSSATTTTTTTTTTTSTANVDAREYEQMPRESTGLGKSEWQQQIANSSKSISDGRDREEMGVEMAGDPQKELKKGGEEKEVSRPRRSNNLVVDDYEASSSSSSSDGGKNNNSNSNNYENGIAMHESSSSTSSVTSARFESDREKPTSNKAQTQASISAEDDDKSDNNSESGSVQFSDFDVHMALGYAFVADSRGRIHRFRLSGSEKVGIANENLMGHDYTKLVDSVDAGSSVTEGLSQSTLVKTTTTSAIGRIFSRPSFIQSPASDSGSSGDDDVDGNEVDAQKGNVTHEKSGRHPMVSGNDGLLTVSGSNDAPTSEPSTLANQKLKHQRDWLAEASKPKIIWSRNRHGFSDAAPQQQQSHRVLSAKGASPPGRQSELDGDEFNQMANETWHMGSGDSVESDEQSSSPSNKQSKKQTESGEISDVGQATNKSNGTLNVPANNCKSKHGSAPLSTEIAVDWLNNLLFVLDKYRLVVIDFDGNNELVLIDDFSTNNRPIDIKVDPANNFLFWLQVGTFHNTIYKLDLNSVPSATERLLANPAKLGQSGHNIDGGQDASSSELIALISHHYAHPIITNLPQHARIFTIDHKHSKIYVPLTPRENNNSFERNRTREDTVVFGTIDDLNTITHMNSTSEQMVNSPIINNDESNNCSTVDSSSTTSQILAYNLDGTDVGPLRSIGEESHLANIDDMQDITVDSDNGYLYWLTNEGGELFEEYKNEQDASFYSAQHKLNGKKYSKLMHFGLNQPTNLHPRFNLRRLIQLLSSSTSTNRWIRSDDRENHKDNLSPSEWGRNRPESDSDITRNSREAPYIILGITCLAVLIVYLVYTFVFLQFDRSSTTRSSRGEGSIASSSVAESHIDCEANTSPILGASSITRWIVKPNTRGPESLNYNRDSSGNDRVDSCDIDSNNYDTSNAVEEHYREQSFFEYSNNRLANLSEWPMNLNDLSNKLYVPAEVLQDEALSSIRRITIGQLDIERKAPLGEGHFGTVLQGTITCTSNEKTFLLNKSQAISISIPTETLPSSPSNNFQNNRVNHPSSTSSGHGSSSTSSDFITATSCAGATNGDYLIPKSQCNSADSDYDLENPTTVGSNSTSSYYKDHGNYNDLKNTSSGEVLETNLKVAIKKLKDNASAEEKRDFLQEAKLLANFNHPNIVHLIGICLDRGSTLIVMELMLGGDLIRYMQENAPRSNNPDNLNLTDLLKICLDIVNGCCYLEEHNYIHRDLAARNCLVSSRKKEERVVKLADFGLARDIYKDSYYKKLNDSAMPLKWMAPECLSEQKFTTMSDVWSFGVVMWEVMSFCQEKPYGNVEPFFMRDHLAGGKRLSQPEICDDDVYRLMQDCWQFNPRKRPTFQECRAVLIQIKSKVEGTV